MSVSGFPPFKEKRHSLRNPTHRFYDRFVALRRAAEEAMRGRRWFDGPVALELVLYAPAFEKGRGMIDYLGGVMDTLDGSHGFTFTYLPIVFQDDCQVCSSSTFFSKSSDARYTLQATFGFAEYIVPDFVNSESCVTRSGHMTPFGSQNSNLNLGMWSCL